MATQVQFRGGTTTEHASFNGAAREVTVDTTKQTLVVQDGTTNGGFPLLRENGSQSLTTTGTINIDSDSSKLKLGADQDMEVYHNGTDAFILNTTGDFKLLAKAGDVAIKIVPDGAVDLRWDDSPKLTTSASGVTISGDVALSSATSKILGATSDASDNGQININAGGDASQTRGAGDAFYGNEHASLPGKRYVMAGNVSGGDILFYTQGSARATIAYNGLTSFDVGTTNNATAVQVKNDSTSAYSISDGGLNTALSLYSDGTDAAQSVGLQLYLSKSGETGAISELGAVRESSGNSSLVFRTRDSTHGVNERMRIDSSGRLGVNIASPHSYYANSLVVKCPSEGGITLRNTNATDWNYIMFAASDTSNGRYSGWIGYDHDDHVMQVKVNEDVTGKGFKFKPDGDFEIEDGNLVVANGHGINFSATSHVTGVESELLDDYESGTWTADVVTGTCSQQSCNYVKVGGLVHIWGRIHGFSDTTTNIVLKITGLPYTCSTSNAGGSIFSKDVSTAASTTYITTNEDLTFYGQNSSNAWSYITHLSCGSNTEIYFHASYTSAAN